MPQQAADTASSVACNGLVDPAGCGDTHTDDDGLCAWHRNRRQRADLGVEMLAEAQRLIARIASDGPASVARRGLPAMIARCTRVGLPAAACLSRGRIRSRLQELHTFEAVMESAEMRALVRQRPHQPKWMRLVAPWPAASMAALATGVAMAAPTARRPLTPATVAEAVRELRLVRDPAEDWVAAEALDQMVAALNADAVAGA